MIEIITDLALDIANNPCWSFTKFHSPIPEVSTIPSPTLLQQDIPIGEALPSDVDVPLPRHGYFDSYVDDIIGICLHIGQNAQRTIYAILLTIYLMARPFCPNNDTSTDVLHSYILSTKKWLAEGAQEEVKTILGWQVDTRRLVVSLPQDKYLAYSKQIQQVLSSGKTDHKTWRT